MNTHRPVDYNEKLPEHYTISPGATVYDYFNTLRTVAAWNDGELMWFRPNAQRRLGPGVIIQRVVAIHHLGEQQVYVPTPDTPAPSWVDTPSSTPVEYHYRQWTLEPRPKNDIHSRIVKPENLRQRPLIPRAEAHPSRIERSYRPATIPEISRTFGETAQTFGDLAYYTQPYIDWLNTRPSPDTSEEARQLPAALLAKGLELAAKQDALGSADTNPFLATIASIQHERPGYAILAAGLSTAMGEYLLGQKQLAKTSRRAPTDQLILDTVRTLDEHHLLTSDFWIGAGMSTTLPMHNKDFLRLLHDKMVGGGSMDPTLVTGQESIDTDEVVRTYMTNLLRAYTQDFRCDITEVHRILKYCLSEQDGLVDPTKLTILGNRINKRWGYDRVYSVSKPRDAINALQRALSVTAFSTLEEEMKESLSKEHFVHAKILAAFFDRTATQQQQSFPRQRTAESGGPSADQ